MGQLSQSEETAERIYNLLRNGKMSERQLTLNFQRLNEKKDYGIDYLIYLLLRSNNLHIYMLLIKLMNSI
jgi:hypothetical protein